MAEMYHCCIALNRVFGEGGGKEDVLGFSPARVLLGVI